MRLNPRTLTQIDSPIGATYALIDGRRGARPLLDLAQAAPGYPPPAAVSDHIAAVAKRPDGAGYVEIAGLPKLREVLAAELSHAYRGTVEPANVVVTAGCNQAFCLTTSALTAPGDEIILPLPYYFNHDMWLRLDGVRPVYIEPGPDLVPAVDAAAAAITDRTRAIVLVTPANPSGVTTSPATIGAFAALAAAHGIALILDETYRSFRGTDEPAHALFADAAWEDTVVSLHSFSKDLAIPGYRVGAAVGPPALIREIMKLLDCVAICAPRIGQEAAWAGLCAAGSWRRERAAEIHAKQKAFEAVMARRPGGFELLTCGAYFGWVRHPFAGHATEELVRDLVVNHDVLVMPGTAFLPDDRGTLRLSFANLELDAMGEVGDRLAAAGAAASGVPGPPNWGRRTPISSLPPAGTGCAAAAHRRTAAGYR